MNPKLSLLFLSFAALLFASGCQGSTPTTTGPTGTTKASDKPASGYFSDHWTAVQPSHKREGNSQVSPLYGRTARRLTLVQLRATIPRLFDGLTWFDRDKKTHLFNKYARTLGEADYLFLTSSSRIPTALFMKFMDDMAGNVCKNAVDADLKNTDTDKRMIVRYEKEVDRNLRFLRLKLHTIYVPENTTKGIESLRTLYDNILIKTSQNRALAWRGVCFAMLTAPEFFAY